MSNFQDECLQLVSATRASLEDFSQHDIKKLLDHTCLNKSSTLQDIMDDTNQMDEVAAVCVYPENVQMVRNILPNARVATVINFPTGEDSLANISKQYQLALSAGAHEIDMVLPYKKYLAGDIRSALAPIHTVRQSLDKSKTLKVILEVSEFDSLEQIKRASIDCLAAGADFIKTSTGKSHSGATLPKVAAILLALKSLSADNLGCKVSGGLASISDATDYCRLACLVFDRSWLTPQHFRLGASRLLAELSNS